MDKSSKIKTVMLVVLPVVLSSSTVYFLKNSEVEKLKREREHYKTAHVIYQQTIIENINDTLAEYVTSLKEHGNAQTRGNRSDSMKAVDKVNALSGKLSGLGVDGTTGFKSEVCYDRFSGGYISDRTLKADKEQIEDVINNTKGKVSRVIAWRKKLIDWKEGESVPETPK